MDASGTNVAAPTIAKRCIMAAIAGPPWSRPDLAQVRIIGPAGYQFHHI
jgi:hypothetical protein